MIYTVTCNPSIDYRMDLPQLRPGETNRAASVSMLAGGKGLNVSMVLQHLHMGTTALGFAAGFVGTEIEQRMKKSGCRCQFIHLPHGCSRINVKLSGKAETTELNAPGPEIPSPALEELTRQLSQLTAEDVLILAGSVPPSMPKNIYADWLEQLKDKNLTAVVDATGDTLLAALPCRPFLIKPNHHELGDLFDVTIDSPEKAAEYGQRLQEMGARNVLVSMSGDGAVLCTEDGSLLRVPAAEGAVKNDVGAGDSMIAGFVTGWLQTKDYAQALHLGAAAGAASAFSETLAEKEEIDRILEALPFPTAL